MSHLTEGPGLGAALGKFDGSNSNERFWQMFTNVKIRKAKVWGLEELKMMLKVVEERILNKPTFLPYKFPSYSYRWRPWCRCWCAVAHSFQVLKYYWYFLIVFLSRHCLYIKGRFYIKCCNVFWCRSCGNRYSFTKSKMKKYYWELLIVGYKVFLGVSQNLAARILQ